MGVKAVFQKVKQNIPFWNEKLPEMPDLVYDYLKLGKDAQQQQVALLREIRQENQKNNQRIVYSILIGSFLVCLAIIFH